MPLLLSFVQNNHEIHSWLLGDRPHRQLRAGGLAWFEGSEVNSEVVWFFWTGSIVNL